MSGHKQTSDVRTKWMLPTEVVIESIVVGVGLFEAVLFLLGALTGNVTNLTIALGALYFALPYNLLMIGTGLSSKMLSLSPLQKMLGIIGCNVPLLGYLLWQGSLVSNYWLLSLALIGLLFNMPKLHIRTIPGVDVMAIALFLAGPFVYGILVAGIDGVWWAAAWLSLLMVVAANYLMYKLPTIGLEHRLHLDSTDARLGVERSLAASISLYLVAALLPLIAYGWSGLPATVIILWYVLVALQAIPHRLIAGAAGLYRVWRAIWWLNYPVGILLGAYAWYLIARS